MEKTSKNQMENAWSSAKEAVKNIWYTLNNIVASVWNTLKAWWYIIDAADKKIWEKLDERSKKRRKSVNKLQQRLRRNIIKLLLVAGIATHWTMEIKEMVHDRKTDNIELTIDGQHITINVNEIFNDNDVLKDLKWSWKDWQEKRYNNYLWNNEAWNIMNNNFWIKERKKVIEWFCRMIESWDINMIFEKADEAWVPRQCIYLALAESWRQAWANSWVAWWYRQFTKETAKSYWLIDKNWNDFRSDPEKSTEAAMKHLKDNYEQVTRYANNKWYNMSESDKWIFAFFMYNWSPTLVKAWIDECKWNANEYSKKLVALAKKNNGIIGGRKVDARQNANYLPRILWVQDALETTFKNNEYDINKVRESENIVTTHVKTTADQMYEDYQKEMEWLTTSQKIKKLKEIKAQYDAEYKAKQITKKYHDWAIKVIDEDIENLENED